MSVRNRERRQAERNLANKEMWKKKFYKAMDKYDKHFKSYRNMLVLDPNGYRTWAFGPALIKNGGKP